MLGILYFIGAISWAAFVTFLLVLGRAGDGAVGVNQSSQMIAYTPSLYLFLLAMAFIPGLVKFVNFLLISSGVLLVFFSALCFRSGEIIAPLLLIVSGVVAYPELRRKVKKK
ncbi:MAG TPA: hypothetical protein VN873_19705 [Candidatus Angelobacter sp.]|nr:hypothetical protein [Candidatus Angelobacter sp.]